MKWVLIFIGLTGKDVVVAEVGVYNALDLCFHEREVIVEGMGRPIINYQAVCIAKAKPYLDEKTK
jgi:hypothetical protein